MKDISKGEERIMCVVWDSEYEASMNSVRADANKRFNREWAPQTITTFLGRLCKKEWLEVKRKGRVVYYHPIISKKDYRKSKLHELLKELYDGDIEALKADL